MPASKTKIKFDISKILIKEKGSLGEVRCHPSKFFLGISAEGGERFEKMWILPIDNDRMAEIKMSSDAVTTSIYSKTLGSIKTTDFYIGRRNTLGIFSDEENT